MPKKYRNVMEELQRQAANQEIFNHHQAIAYALNRLQPLYVTTEEGWLRQRNYAISIRR
ncbi:MAG: late competence development ComFB family protein [Pseudanabaenaceae cyanobacterium]